MGDFQDVFNELANATPETGEALSAEEYFDVLEELPIGPHCVMAGCAEQFKRYELPKEVTGHQSTVRIDACDEHAEMMGLLEGDWVEREVKE